ARGYPAVRPEPAARRTAGRPEYVVASDREPREAAELVARTEGIIVALETAHAVAALGQIAERVGKEQGRPARLALCLSGRGGKDLATLRRHHESLTRETSA